jgi:hypothetical protein
MASKGWHLGGARPLGGRAPVGAYHLPSHHLVTHGVVVGMTGSGKSGLLMVMLEEALRSGVPALIIDVKGDLPNLLLSFPSFDSTAFLPWVESVVSATDERPHDEVAREMSSERERGLSAWGIGESELRAYSAGTHIRVITPGSSAGEGLHVLSGLERSAQRWARDPEAARSALSAAVSLVLRLVGRDHDPARSREHVLLSLLAERRLSEGGNADLPSLLEDLANPPLDRVGALELNAFIPKKDRLALSAALNTLLASPTFSSWREGVTLDIGEWLKPVDGRTPAVIVSVAHLDDEERALVLGLLLEEVLTWVRGLSGTRRLRALVAFDEVYGFLPPHPHNPPTKPPLVALLKQARAFGVGVLVATQNPMDLDYRALSNAGLWCVGRLQTDADRERIVEGLSHSGEAGDVPDLDETLARLKPRWFVVRNAHCPGTVLLQPRWAMSFMKGPMTREEIQRARTGRGLYGQSLKGSNSREVTP